MQSIFRQPLVLKSTSLYALVGHHAVLFDEVFGLFCKARREDGGLGFVSAQIGLCFSVMGVLLLMYQRAYRHVNDRIGSVRVCQVRKAPVSIPGGTVHGYSEYSHRPTSVRRVCQVRKGTRVDRPQAQ